MIERVLKRLIPFDCHHKELSAIASTHDESRPNDYLIDLAIKSIQKARDIDLSDIEKRAKGTIYEDLNTWPGGQYRLLAAIVSIVKPRRILEIGTARGASALVMDKYMERGMMHGITTYDIHKGAGQFFTEDDRKRITQITKDISHTEYVTVTAKMIRLGLSDMIFIDGPKDGKMEYRLMKEFERLGLKDGTLLIFDDIKVWNMLKLWREIKHPKLDLTSFGHWSGTGIVQWKTGEQE